MSQQDFYQTERDEQIRRLGGLARSALRQWGLEGAAVRPLAYRENMTFAIDAGPQSKFALRIHQAGYRSDTQVQSELDFMEHLNAEGVETPSVVRSARGTSFVLEKHEDVPEPRQCDLFRWIDGKPIRETAKDPELSVPDARRLYSRVGRLAAGVYNASEKWAPPQGFDRPAWDAEGIFGSHAHLGDFRKCAAATEAQIDLLDSLANRLASDLSAFGKGRDRYGLSQADFLPENIMQEGSVLRLIDFDDAGESWIMFDVVTAVWDLKLLGSAYFEPCYQGFVEGFRQLRGLPDDHLEMFETFFLARVLSYLGHTVSRSHLGNDALQPIFLGALESQGGEYLER